jgi:hypothetical protein
VDEVAMPVVALHTPDLLNEEVLDVEPGVG